ncbi:hypothetical protein MCAV_02280 [[Mycoplasma] cavipharyngis]|uniref:hypothetical protein n=1 Tax=[Mycoplasma] cavipharyngis TaxID=92757 RepID=UPI0037038F65
MKKTWLKSIWIIFLLPLAAISFNQENKTNIIKQAVLDNKKDNLVNNNFTKIYAADHDQGITYSIPKIHFEDFKSKGLGGITSLYQSLKDYERTPNKTYFKSSKKSVDLSEDQFNRNWILTKIDPLRNAKLQFKFSNFASSILFKNYFVERYIKNEAFGGRYNEDEKWANFNGYGIKDLTQSRENNLSNNAKEIKWSEIPETSKDDEAKKFVIFNGRNNQRKYYNDSYTDASINLFIKKAKWKITWWFVINTNFHNKISFPSGRTKSYDDVADPSLSAVGYNLDSINLAINYVPDQFQDHFDDFKTILGEPINIQSDESNLPNTINNANQIRNIINERIKNLKEKSAINLDENRKYYIFNDGKFSDITFEPETNNLVLSWNLKSKNRNLNWTISIPWNITLNEEYYKKQVKDRVNLIPGLVPKIDPVSQKFVLNQKKKVQFVKDQYELISIDSKGYETRVYHAPVQLNFRSNQEQTEVIYVNGKALDVLNLLSNQLLRDGRFDFVDEQNKLKNQAKEQNNQQTTKTEYKQNEYLIEVKRDDKNNLIAAQKDLKTIYQLKIIVESNLNNLDLKYFAWNPDAEGNEHQKLWITPKIKDENGEEIDNPEYNPNINPTTGTIKRILWVKKPANFPFLSDPDISDEANIGYIAEGSISYKGINRQFSTDELQKVDQYSLGELKNNRIINGNQLNIVDQNSWIFPTKPNRLFAKLSKQNQTTNDYLISLFTWNRIDLINLYAYIKKSTVEKEIWLNGLANAIGEAIIKLVDNQKNLSSLNLNFVAADDYNYNLFSIKDISYAKPVETKNKDKADQVAEAKTNLVNTIKTRIETAIKNYGSSLDFNKVKLNHYLEKDINPDTDNTFQSISGWYQYSINKNNKSFGAKIVQIRRENLSNNQKPEDILNVINEKYAVDFWTTIQAKKLLNFLKKVYKIDEKAAKELPYEAIMAAWNESLFFNLINNESIIKLNVNNINDDDNNLTNQQISGDDNNLISSKNYLIDPFKTNQPDPIKLENQVTSYVANKLNDFGINDYQIQANEQTWKELTTFSEKRRTNKVTILIDFGQNESYQKLKLIVINSLDLEVNKLVDLSKIYFPDLTINSTDPNYIKKLIPSAITEYLRRWTKQHDLYPDLKYKTDFEWKIIRINGVEKDNWTISDLIWSKKEPEKIAAIAINSITDSLKTTNSNKWVLINSNQFDPKNNPVIDLANCVDDVCSISNLPGLDNVDPFDINNKIVEKNQSETTKRILYWTVPLATITTTGAIAGGLTWRWRRFNKAGIKIPKSMIPKESTVANKSNFKFFIKRKNK